MVESRVLLIYSPTTAASQIRLSIPIPTVLGTDHDLHHEHGRRLHKTGLRFCYSWSY